MSESSARISLAGEYLAASYLLRYCDSVILAPPGHRSDLILDHDNHLYRVQVKTTNTVYIRRNKDFYRWELRASKRTANNIRQNKMVRYGNGQIDIFCFVALPINKVFFDVYDGTKNLTEVSKSIKTLDKIDSKDSLLQALLKINKTPELSPLGKTD
jgi:hypothetical protein